MKKSGCLGVVLFLALCLSLLVNMLLLAGLSALLQSKGGGMFKSSKAAEFDEEVLVSGGKEKIAVIPVEGIIAFSEVGPSGNSMVEEIKKALEQAAEDTDVAGVVLSVDSPGGEVTASDVLYEAINKFSEEKPVVVFMNSVGASGAYYLACGAGWIMCNPTTFTGSIGVIITTLNYENLFGKIGLESIVFKSGQFKDMLSGARPISPEEAAYVQGMVMQSYERFVGIVAKSRGINPEVLRNGLADGRIFSGVDALAAGLVDQVGYIEEAYAKAMALAGVQEATVVRYTPVLSFSHFLRLLGQGSQVGSVQVNLWPKPLALEPGRLYLLPPLFAR